MQDVSSTILQTPRLILRSFREDDLDAYSAICADPEVMQYIADGKSLTRNEAWRNMATILGHWKLRGYGLWAVELRESKELIGRIGFWNPEGWPGFELGWLLGRKYWGKGYATEGARRAMEYGFRELGQKQIISLIRPGNINSIRVAERLGEKLRGGTEVMGLEALVYGIEE